MGQITTTKSMSKKFILVFIVTFSSIAYLIPYMAYDFYNQFLEAYHVSDAQMGWLLSAFAASAVPSYFIGGWIADVFNPKKLLVMSCISTGLVSFAVSFCSSFPLLVFLFFLFGITAITLNWTAYLKIVKMLGGDDEQGRLFAATDIAYALFSLILEYVVLVLVTYIVADNPMGFKIAYLIYGSLSIIIGIAIWYSLPSMTYEKEGKGLKEDVRLMGHALKLPVTWYLGVFTLGYFLIRSVIPYVNPYLTDAYDQSVVSAQVFTTTIRTMTLMIFSPIGGMLRDRMGASSSRLIQYFSLGCIAFSLILMLIPQGKQFAIWIMIVSVLVLVFNSLMSNFLYTVVTNASVPILYVGSVFGVASAIGYSSDLWLYTLCGTWLDNMGNAGYRLIWLVGAIGGLMMFAMGITLTKKYGAIEAKAAEEAKTEGSVHEE
ncbi:MAG: MFS transporter [Eubacteriales bacterium]|nr:MFS transporter [Eubacteriales bacterium]